MSSALQTLDGKAPDWVGVRAKTTAAAGVWPVPTPRSLQGVTKQQYNLEMEETEQEGQHGHRKEEDYAGPPGNDGGGG